MHLYQNVQTYPCRENYARRENIFNTIIAAFSTIHIILFISESILDWLL